MLRRLGEAVALERLVESRGHGDDHSTRPPFSAFPSYPPSPPFGSSGAMAWLVEDVGRTTNLFFGSCIDHGLPTVGSVLPFQLGRFFLA